MHFYEICDDCEVSVVRDLYIESCVKDEKKSFCAGHTLFICGVNLRFATSYPTNCYLPIKSVACLGKYCMLEYGSM